MKNTESYRRDLRRAEYGDERDPKMAAFMERIAALNNAQKITKPLFVVAGANDPRVPKSEAEQIVATLKKQKTPVWYMLGKDEGHGFGKKKNADFLFYDGTIHSRLSAEMRSRNVCPVSPDKAAPSGGRFAPNQGDAGKADRSIPGNALRSLANAPALRPASRDKARIRSISPLRRTMFRPDPIRFTQSGRPTEHRRIKLDADRPAKESQHALRVL